MEGLEAEPGESENACVRARAAGGARDRGERAPGETGLGEVREAWKRQVLADREELR